MDAVNPILVKLGRTLVEATAAHSSGDREAVDLALESASKLAGRLLDAVGGCSAMGSAVGEAAMALYSEIETVELDAPADVIFRALCRSIGLLVVVARTANGPNPFAPVPGADTGEDAIVPVVSPRNIGRA